MDCWQPASSALLEWLPLASCPSWSWQCEATDALQGAWATALACRQLHAGLIISFMLLQAQCQGQIHEGLLVRDLLHSCMLCTRSSALSVSCGFDMHTARHAHCAVTPSGQTRCSSEVSALCMGPQCYSPDHTWSADMSAPCMICPLHAGMAPFCHPRCIWPCSCCCQGWSSTLSAAWWTGGGTQGPGVT